MAPLLREMRLLGDMHLGFVVCPAFAAQSLCTHATRSLILPALMLLWMRHIPAMDVCVSVWWGNYSFPILFALDLLVMHPVL